MNKIERLLPTVNRASNNAVRNSKALTYTEDSFGMICLLNTKDLKSAGEQQTLNEYVITNEDTDADFFYSWIYKFAEKRQNLIKKEDEIQRRKIVIDGFISDCPPLYIEQIDILISIKKYHPHIISFYFDDIVYFQTKGNSLIKYSSRYDCYFSCEEIAHFNVPFEECTMFSTTALSLPVCSLQKTQSAKNTVAINNIRGGASNRIEDWMMEGTLGVSVCIEDDERNEEDVFRGYEPFVDARWSEWEKDISMLLRIRNSDARPFLKDRSRKEVFENLVFKMYDPRSMLFGNKLSSRTKTIQRIKISNEEVASIKKYLKMLKDENENNTTDPYNIWNFTLYASFGNINGSCIEDGVIIDKRTAECLSAIKYKAMFVVEFEHQNESRSKESKFIRISDDITDGESLVGCLIARKPIPYKSSNHCKVEINRIGQHYYHLIYFYSKGNKIYNNFKLRYFTRCKTTVIVMSGTYHSKIRVGTKIANGFGQKNVVSHIVDLSHIRGTTRDGRVVHPQIIYSDISIIGRTTAGQKYSMLSSPHLALTEKKEIISPIQVIIHTMHPYANVKLFQIKVDTLTCANGFVSQNLSHSCKMLKEGKIVDKVKELFQFHGFAITF